MASSIYDDSSSNSNSSQDFISCSDKQEFREMRPETFNVQDSDKKFNVVNKLFNRQTYGRFTKHPKSKTERIFNSIHCQCRYKLDQLIYTPEILSHIFMGFTLCGQFFISYKENVIYPDAAVFLPTVEYDLYIWRFVAGKRLQYISKHRIFKLLKGLDELDEIMFLQFPTDPYKIICYGTGLTNPVMAFITILTLPVDNCCRHCNGTAFPVDENVSQGWCLNHGFMLHFMFSMAHPTPTFNPHISLSYPDYLVINTGHYIHILNVSTYDPQTHSSTSFSTLIREEDSKIAQNIACNFMMDTFSETSESLSENLGTSSVVEAILEDFSEYDLEGTDCNKPFHELNISCEPLNVTGKSYHNTLVQNIVDPRLKRLQNSKDCLFSVPQSSGLQKPMEKIKIDKKTAEKAYEFTEENEKCEKLSSFRKKRLADKKYEFSEDNTENIVPYHTLRRERRFLCRSQGRYLKSPDYCPTLFLSPRSSGIRSPMQSPNSRSGQFSPGGARHLYCPVLRNSPHHSKSPISPRDSSRKFNVYSPSLDSDCSDYDSKLILKQVNNFSTSLHDLKIHQNFGLLIVDTKKEESSKWIKKLVRRYSSADFETSSLVSGQSKDDYNIPIEIPLIVQTLMDQQLDIVPEFKDDHISETQLIITQRTFDCEQFVQRRAQKLCAESQLEFLHCEDYDIRLQHICPINGHIVCLAVIKIGALKLSELHAKPNVYTANCVFTWNIVSDAFEVIEPPDDCKLELASNNAQPFELTIPSINRKTVLVMDYNCHSSKTSLRDYNNYYEITAQNREFFRNWPNPSGSSTLIISDSD